MKAKKLAVLMAIGLLPLAGCAAPRDRYASGAYAGHSSGPYDAYDSDFDDGDAGYGPPPAPYYSQGSPGYGPQGGAGYYSQGYSAPAYPAPAYSGPSYSGPSYSGQATYGGTPSYGATSYGTGYRQSDYSSSYYSAPQPPPVPYPLPGQPPSYYSTQYSCGCAR